MSLINTGMITLFIPTFFFVSATPGMCMTLSMTLGMTVGHKRALWMMIGELLGVGLVVVLSMIGVAAMMLKYPAVFEVFKWLGGAYLAYLGIQLWRSRGRLALPEQAEEAQEIQRLSLATQGFVTAIVNPKGWAFMIALLPPFIDQSLPLASQMLVLTMAILVIEFICLNLYAAGGQRLAKALRQRSNVRAMNRISGTLMIGVGIWLVLT